MEGPLSHVLHGAILAVVLYVVMKFVLKQRESKALSRSVLIGLLAASYMLVFGHKMPGRVNPQLM